jgi:hypothetical protein
MGKKWLYLHLQRLQNWYDSKLLPKKQKKIYFAVSRKHIVGVTMLYGGDFNMFTMCVMVDLSAGLGLVNCSNANSNRIITPFGSLFS